MPETISGFKPANIFSLEGNVFTMLDKDWMLLTAGVGEEFNTMTASWGGFGILWNKPVAFVFIRPQRFTYEFAERHTRFTLSFFGGNQRKALSYLGKVSGRDTNKIAASGLNPVILDSGSIAFREAALIMDCEKIYFNDLLSEHFLDPGIEGMYKNQDYHRMYIGEIKSVMKAENYENR